MEIKDWQRVEELYHEASALPAEERAAFLNAACAGDDPVRREVESLLAAVAQHPDFMERSMLSLGMAVLAQDAEEKSLVGESVGPYRIKSALGRGGMGQVYLAEHVRLERKVALKFLSPKLMDDVWAKRRFIKEAQAVARLDHQNICGVYGFEEDEGHSFIVMHYVEGETLADLVSQRPLSQSEVLDLAHQIVGAISEAHAHGILHRDIKPQNIMVTPGGKVKVLDFGLAKLLPQQQGLAMAAEHASDTTRQGMIVGTAAYMSPEQLRGERLDYRSDVFSCGALLYELLSGHNPFAYASTAETISAVLTYKPPPLKGVAPHVSHELARLVHTCLEKDREQRYHSASELLYEVEALRTRGGRGPSWWRSPVVRIAAALAVVLLLAALSVLAYMRLTKVPTLAVLPVVNEGADASFEYLGNGLTEGVVMRLSRLQGLRVRAPSAVSGEGGRRLTPLEVGRALNADAVLASTITQRDGSLLLQTSLVNTADGSRLWSGSYELTVTEIFGVQEDMAGRVASRLNLRLGGREKGLLAARGTESPEAFRQYMLGRHDFKNRDRDNIERALAHFEAAVKLDPVYAQAHAGVADCYLTLNTVAYGHVPTEEAMTKARAAAKQALEIDDTLPEAHTSMGVVYMKYDWDWEAAEGEFLRALELNADYAPAHYWYSNLLAATGRHGRSLTESKIARDLDPFSTSTRMNFCRAFYFARQYDSASDCFGEILKNNPDNTNARYVLGLVRLQQGMHEEAIDAFRQIYAKNKSLAAAPLGFAYGKANRRGEALEVLAEIEELSRQLYIPPQERAVIYAGLGERDRALEWLEKAYQERFSSLMYLGAEPLFDDLRQDGRFIDLTRRLNLSDR